MSYTDAYISATRGTKENPYSSFSEAMKDGREGQNVYVGKTGEKPTYTKMAYADSSPSSKSSKKKDSASTFFDDNASGIVRDVATALMFPVSIPFTIGKYLFGGQDREGNQRKGIFSLGDGDGSSYTYTKDGKVKNIFGQELNMDNNRKITGFLDSLDVDGDGSMLTTGGKFFTPQTPKEQQAYLDRAIATGGGGGSDSSPTSTIDPNAVGVLPDGTLKCKEGFYYDIKTQMCVKMEEETSTVKAEPVGIQTLQNPLTYGQTGGEQILSPAVATARDGMAVQNLRRQPSGIVTGPGGPKDDLVGPIALSAQEFVMPKEQIIDEGNGDYNKGIRKLESQRKKSLKKYDVA